MFYIGHSMGSTTYMVMNSLDQTWADRNTFKQIIYLFSPYILDSDFVWRIR